MRLNIFRGYERIATGILETDALAFCVSECKRIGGGIGFELVKTFGDDDVKVLVFRYNTLYFETFLLVSPAVDCQGV